MRIPLICQPVLLLIALALAACAPPVAHPPATAATPTAPATVSAPAPTAGSNAPVAGKPMAGRPVPSRPFELPATAVDADAGVGKPCASDTDCALKDAGSCCGVRPVCVHKDTPTFPEKVKAKCEEQGRVGICGFPAISGCQCVAGKCEGVPIMENGLQVQ